MIAKDAPLIETARLLADMVDERIPGVYCEICSFGDDGRSQALTGPFVGTIVTSSDREAGNETSGANGSSLWSTYLKDETGAAIGMISLYASRPGDVVEIPEAVIATCGDLGELAFRLEQHGRERAILAAQDVLTGLPGRSALNTALGSLSCGEQGSWALMIVDLDNLKSVNDVFGHLAGDALIRVAAARIAAVTTSRATFRVGGDEFAIIVRDGAQLADLDGLAQAIFASLAHSADCAGHQLTPAATIGAAVLGAGETALTVCQNADFALYHAKETCRGSFVRYWHGIDTRIMNRIKTIPFVSAAIAQDRVEAHYQPIMGLEGIDVVGVEALCRICEPGGAVIAAQEFLEATADMQVATAITDRMLAIVARDVRLWREAGRTCHSVGLNVSTADLYSGDLLRRLECSFRKTGITLDALFLEVNEDVWMGRKDKVVAEEIARLRGAGVRVAVDNFGTGPASLARLIEVPVDILKIDRSLISRSVLHAPERAILRAVPQLTRELGIELIAGGIETREQAADLWKMGYALGQGYCFTPPMVAKAMEAMLPCRREQGGRGELPGMRQRAA